MLVGSALGSSWTDDFLKIASRSELANWLNISDRKLRFLLYVIKPEARYTKFSIPKKHGGHRVISAPAKPLKFAQRKLQKALDVIGKPSSIACGFVSGKSIIDHAGAHRRKRWVLCIDLKDFFPSINFGRIRGLFLAPPFNFNVEVATCLAQLCIHENALPQGAPTSPTLSNIIAMALDRALKEVCRNSKCDVTRYADDICISSNLKSIPTGIAVKSPDGWIAGPLLAVAITDAGFVINPVKTKLRTFEERQLVTGLVVNHEVMMPRRWRRQLRCMLHLRKTHGAEKAMSIVRSWPVQGIRRKKQKTIDAVISGKAGFAFHLEEKRTPVFTFSLFRGYPESRKLIPKPYKAMPFRIYTEGKTDPLHLEAALKYFQERNEFEQFMPRFPAIGVGTGASFLLGQMLSIAKAVSSELSIGVFDCDDLAFMSKHQLSPGGFRRIGKSTYLLCLGAADFVPAVFCIEDLYLWVHASRWTPDERRLFKKDEFNANGLDASGTFKLGEKGGKSSFVTTSVIRLADNHSCLLSKATFANLVSKKLVPFGKLDFEGFRLTFEALAAVLEDYYEST